MAFPVIPAWQFSSVSLAACRLNYLVRALSVPFRATAHGVHDAIDNIQINSLSLLDPGVRCRVGLACRDGTAPVSAKSDCPRTGVKEIDVMFSSFIERSVWISTLLAALGTGVMSGVFFAFSSFVMKALAFLPVPQGIVAMQAINTAAINPAFLAAFLGSVLLCTLLAVYSVASWHQRGTSWILIGSLLGPY
jgi:hypothetical protein